MTTSPPLNQQLMPRLQGLAASLVILLLVAGVPALLLAIGATPWHETLGNSTGPSSLGDLKDLLTSPDDGTLALLILACVAWIAWAVVCVSVVLEAVARMRGLPAPALPGLKVPQRAAGQLVAIAALLFVATPALIVAFPTAPARASAVPSALAHDQHPLAHHIQAAPAPAQVSRVPAATQPATNDRPTVSYTVRRGDSLWKIADRLLGNGARYTEIVDLNQDVLGGRPDFIVSGTVLRVPDETTPVDGATGATAGPTGTTSSSHPAAQPEEYVVERGDTLSGIAEETLGDSALYPELFEASRDTIQHDGARLTDPNLIRPGWQITIPTTPQTPGTSGTDSQVDKSSAADPPAHQHPPAGTPDTHGSMPHETPPLSAPVSPSPSQTAETPSVPGVPTAFPSDSAEIPPTVEAEHADKPDGDAESEAEDVSPSWLLPGLTGAGALLAGAVLLAVRAHRRTQQRYRRPGFTIAAPPPEVRSVEKTTAVTGTPAADVIGQLDRLLRHLAANSPVAPQLEAIEIDQHTVTLHLVEPTDLPKPWAKAETKTDSGPETGAGIRWTADLDSPVGEEDQLSPYPLLTSIGQGDDGHLWLLDLERLGSLALTGNTENAQALARHIAAELTLSPWAVIAEIDTFNVAPELAVLDPRRLHHHPAHDTEFLEFLERLHHELDQAQQNSHGEPEPFRALLLADTTSDDPDDQDDQAARVAAVRALAHLIRRQQSRSGLALVALRGQPDPDDVALELTPEGRVRAPHLGLDLVGAGLTATEAEACAAIVDLTRVATLVPIPRHHQATDRTEEDPEQDAGQDSGWRALADQAGALIPDLLPDMILDRPAGEAGARSLLPEATQRYEAVTATTADDVEALAPVVLEQAQSMVEDVDPRLDEDLAEWCDPGSDLPKLRLLGPVTVIATAVAPTAVLERKAYFTELVTFLALHPSGVSSRQVREALGMTQSRARTDLGYIRAWFGTNPRTGTQHLPPATTSPAHKDRGTSGYQLNDVLVDLDLFRRLRARAQARGAAGMADLVAALELVVGEPFSALRDPGWSWLLDDERVHETTTFAVVDVAHLVATDALSRGDLAGARLAAETGCVAAPYDEVCRLDLAKVAEAEGHTRLADQILDEHVFNRTDDHLPPIDLPERTRKVVTNNAWGHPKRPKSG